MRQVKIAFISSFLIMVFGTSIKAQNLSLSNLLQICSKEDWVSVNQLLSAKGWEYYESSQGDEEHYSTVTWSYGRNNYDDAANGWFYLYTYEGSPGKISYTTFSQSSYSKIDQSLRGSGFKLESSKIEDNVVKSSYKNNSYTLNISLEKREKDGVRSTTAYEIKVTKSKSVYDPNNGSKKSYYDNGNLKAEYVLKAGEFNGPIKTYHENEDIKMTGFYLNGEKHGDFVEFDIVGDLELKYQMNNGELNGYYEEYKDGTLVLKGRYKNGKKHGDFQQFDSNENLLFEYQMQEGLLNGFFKSHEGGKLTNEGTYLNDKKQGTFTEYIYNDDSNILNGKLKIQYENNQKHGLWQLILSDQKGDKLLSFYNYSHGEKDGPFQKVSEDSLIVGSYKVNEFHGSYKIYLDISKRILGGIISTDTSKLDLITKGYYQDGIKNGKWSYFDFSNVKTKEGNFQNGKQWGKWNYYFGKYSDSDGKELHYSGQKFLTEIFRDGELHGSAIRFAYLNKEEIPCSQMKRIENSSDTCFQNVYEKVRITSTYKKGQLNGPYESIDSLGHVVAKGNYSNEKEEGIWNYQIQLNDLSHVGYVSFEGHFINGEKQGNWDLMDPNGVLSKQMTFKNDMLDGETVILKESGEVSKKEIFVENELEQIEIYDSLGLSKIMVISFYSKMKESYDVRWSFFDSNGYNIIQEYHVYERFSSVEPDWFFDWFLSKRQEENSIIDNHGKYKKINKRKFPVEEGNYSFDVKEGTWSSYFYDQEVVMELTYVNGIIEKEYFLDFSKFRFSGEFVLVDEEKDLVETIKIKNGYRHGKTEITKLSTGELVSLKKYSAGVLK